MIDASWVASEKLEVDECGSTPGVPHVIGPTSAYDEVALRIPPELVDGRYLVVEYRKMWGYGGSSYEIIEYIEPDNGMKRTTIESYESLVAAKKSEFYAIFRAVYSAWKKRRS